MSDVNISQRVARRHEISHNAACINAEVISRKVNRDQLLGKLQVFGYVLHMVGRCNTAHQVKRWYLFGLSLDHLC